MSDSAQIGDTVVIDFNHTNTVRGTVKHMPCDTGDRWTIHTDQGEIVHVQQFDALTVTNRRVATKEPNNGE